MSFRIAVVAVMVLSLVACTTTQSMQKISPQTASQQVDPGDQVFIVAKNGQSYDLEVQEVGPDSLVGKADTGKRYRVNYSAIESIRVSKASPGFETGAGIAVGLIALGVLLVVAVVKGMERMGECVFGSCDDEN